MAIAYSATGTVFNGGVAVTTLTLASATLAANTSLLIGVIAINGVPGTVSMTWDFGGTNQVMTQVGTVSNTVQIFVFKLINPTTGLKTLQAAGIGGRNAHISLAAFSGTDIVTGINAPDTLTVIGTNPTNPLSIGPITSTPDGVTFAVFAINAINVATGQTSQTFVYFLGQSQGFGSGSSRSTTGGAQTHTWSSSATSALWAGIGVHLLAGIGRPGANPGDGNVKQFEGEIQQLGLSNTSVIMNASMGVI